MMKKTKRLVRRQVWWHWILSRYLVEVEHKIIRYGSDYGGWNVPADLIKPDWVVYDIGVGMDITFATELIARHNCAVHAFDPTPKAIAFVAEQGILPNFHFQPVGVWSEDSVIRFNFPREAHFASYSAINLRRQTEYIEAEVKTVKSLARELGHDHIDLLKMDIEGAEQHVIPNLIADGIRPTVLCVEYDQSYETFSRLTWKCFLTSLSLNRDLLREGYKLVSKNGWTVTYLLQH